MGSSLILLMVVFVFLVVLQIIFFVSCYKRVPPDQLLVIYGQVSADPSVQFKVEKSGGHFVWPVIQEFLYLDLKMREYNIAINSQDGKNEFVNLSGVVNIATGSSVDLLSNYLKRFKDVSEGQQVEQIQAMIDQTVKTFILEKTKGDLNLNLARTESELSQSLKLDLSWIGIEVKYLKALTIE